MVCGNMFVCTFCALPIVFRFGSVRMYTIRSFTGLSLMNAQMTCPTNPRNCRLLPYIHVFIPYLKERKKNEPTNIYVAAKRTASKCTFVNCKMHTTIARYFKWLLNIWITCHENVVYAKSTQYVWI